MVFCMKCGTKNEDGDFCSNCGQRLEEDGLKSPNSFDKPNTSSSAPPSRNTGSFQAGASYDSNGYPPPRDPSQGGNFSQNRMPPPPPPSGYGSAGSGGGYPPQGNMQQNYGGYPPQQGGYPPQQQYHPRPSNFGKTVNKFWSEFLQILKLFFSGEPYKSMETCLNSHNQVWIVTLLFHALAMPLITMFLSVNSIHMETLFKLIIVLVAVYFALATIFFGVLKIMKENVSYLQSLNITSISIIPLTIVVLLSKLFSVISGELTTLTILFGLMFIPIYLYGGIQRFFPRKGMSIWLFSAGMILQIIAIYYIYRIFLSSASYGYGNLFGF